MASHDVASRICQALRRGVTRSKRRSMQWLRTAAENGYADSCLLIADRMYADLPYAREVGHVGEVAGVPMSAGVMEGHNVPPDVLTSLMYWLHKGGRNAVTGLHVLRRRALEGSKYCRNEGCEVVGQLTDFKVCPRCKSARYCATRARNKTGLPGGTRKSVAHSHIKECHANSPLQLSRAWDVVLS